jgi:3-dehydroquinate dehydratase-1
MRCKYVEFSQLPDAIDVALFEAQLPAMQPDRISPNARQTWVVGSFGSFGDLKNFPATALNEACDMVEIRLDLLGDHAADRSAWEHVSKLPLLFTARRIEEGGGLPLDARCRMEMLRQVLDDAAWVDIEVASIPEMQPILDEISSRDIPWLASFHDFDGLPETAVLEQAAAAACAAGASIFKVAAKLNSSADLARLAEFQLSDQGIPLATMGMGALAPVSRLLCAQCGSRLNYGYLGQSPTAPGQWDSHLLKLAIGKLISIRP